MPVTDDFNRADGGLGANWTSIVNTPRIVSNTFKAQSFNDGAAIFNGTYPNDQYGQCTVHIDATSNDKGGPIVRGQAGGNGYILRVGTDGSSSQIYVMTAGALTIVGTPGGTWADGDTAKLDITGTTLTAFKNGVQVGSTFTDSTYASGSPGVYMNNGLDNKGSLDNFEGSDTSGGATVGQAFWLPTRQQRNRALVRRF